MFVYTKLTKDKLKIFKSEFVNTFEDIRFIKAHNQSVSLVSENEKITADIKLKEKNLLTNHVRRFVEPFIFNSEGYLTACYTYYENNLVYEKYNRKQSLATQFNSTKISNLRKRYLENDLDGLLCKSCIYN